MPPDNFPVLPITGLLRKCCVWCGDNAGGGSCKEPGFSGALCSCPTNTTSAIDVQAIYQCPSGQTASLGCACAGKPVGASACTNAEGTPPGGGVASSLSVSVSLSIVALLIVVIIA